MKMLKIILGCLAVFVYTGGIQAEIIDFPDDDRYQTIPLDCPGADSVAVGFSFNGNPYVEYTYQIPASIVPIQLFEFVNSDRDERGRVIPGHYEDDYFYFADFYMDGLRVASPDTIHILVNYDIGGGCSALPIID